MRQARLCLETVSRISANGIIPERFQWPRVKAH